MNASRASLCGAALALLLASNASASEAELTAGPDRLTHRWTVSAVGSVLLVVPVWGAEVSYSMTDRLALGAQLTTGLPVFPLFDVSAHLRYFFAARERSGFYADLGGHLLGAIGGEGKGGALEIGYERRWSGLTLGLSGGVAVVAASGCGCGIEQRTSVVPFPLLGVRLGHSF
jgi:hypothetical protein